jgi:hypothetical protein
MASRARGSKSGNGTLKMADLTWLESRLMRDRGGVATKCAVELRLSRSSKTQIGETQWPHVHFERLSEALARYQSGRYDASDHGWIR